jgi:hypothetical protein
MISQVLALLSAIIAACAAVIAAIIVFTNRSKIERHN